MPRRLAPGAYARLATERPNSATRRIDAKTPLEIVTDGRNLIISPVNTAKREKKFKAALEKVNRLHGKTLRKLAG